MTAVPCLQRSKPGTAESGALKVCPDVAERQSKGLARNWLRKLGWGESGGRAKQAEGQGKPESVPGARSGAQLTAAVGGPRLQSIPSPSICPQRASLPNQTPQVPACRRDCITGFALSVGARDVIKIWCFSGRSHISSLINPHHATPTRPEPLPPPGLLSTSTTSLRCAAFNRYLAPTVAPNPHQRESHTTLLKTPTSLGLRRHTSRRRREPLLEARQHPPAAQNLQHSWGVGNLDLLSTLPTVNPSGHAANRIRGL